MVTNDVVCFVQRGPLFLENFGLTFGLIDSKNRKKECEMVLILHLHRLS